MRKYIIAVCMVISMAINISAAMAEETYSISPIENIYINDKKLQLQVLPYSVDGVTLVPIRVISEELGAKVIWQKPNVIITKDDVEIELTIDEKEIIVNEKQLTLKQAPILDYARVVYEDGMYVTKPASNERNIVMVPLRFIGEAFGADVNYDSIAGAINITMK